MRIRLVSKSQKWLSGLWLRTGMFLARNPSLKRLDVLGFLLDEFLRDRADHRVGIGVSHRIVEFITAPFTLEGDLERIEARQPRISGPNCRALRSYVVGPERERRNLEWHEVSVHAPFGFLEVQARIAGELRTTRKLPRCPVLSWPRRVVRSVARHPPPPAAQN